MTLICIWLLYDWWFSFRNDILSIFLKWYFEITFFPLKKDCADRHFEITYFSISGQHNLLKDFLWFRFEMIYDFHFEMSNAFLFSFWNALWLSFRNEGAKFSSTELFSSGEPQIFYWRKCIYYYYFRTQLFTQGIVSLSLRWNKFFKKGDGLLCQILIILQC